MSKLRETFRILLDLAGGTAPGVALGPSRRLQLLASAGLSTIAFAGLWGLAVGSSSLVLALANLYKVPMVVLLSALGAVPAGLLAARLLGSALRPSDLVLGLAASVFAGALVLAVLSPLVAVYYHTSAWAGPMLALGSAALAIVTAVGLFVRSALSARPSDRVVPVLIPVASVVLVKLAIMIQLIALASPILPEVTRFDGGIDHLVRR